MYDPFEFEGVFENQQGLFDILKKWLDLLDDPLFFAPFDHLVGTQNWGDYPM